MWPHNPPVVRWDESGFGPPALHFFSCHGAEFMGSADSMPGINRDICRRQHGLDWIERW